VVACSRGKPSERHGERDEREDGRCGEDDVVPRRIAQRRRVQQVLDLYSAKNQAASDSKR
jgi:hypothetical protein